MVGLCYFLLILMWFLDGNWSQAPLKNKITIEKSHDTNFKSHQGIPSSINLAVIIYERQIERAMHGQTIAE